MGYFRVALPPSSFWGDGGVKDFSSSATARFKESFDNCLSHPAVGSADESLPYRRKNEWVGMILSRGPHEAIVLDVPCLARRRRLYPLASGLQEGVGQVGPRRRQGHPERPAHYGGP